MDGLDPTVAVRLAAGASALERAAVDKAIEWFGADCDLPIQWEPSGADFLSPALMEAELMRRALAPDAFRDWLARALPSWSTGTRAMHAFQPVAVSDRADPQIVHLDGLNLSRAWCLRSLARSFPADDGRALRMQAAADAHLAAGRSALDSGAYAGAHWIASFALLAFIG